MSEERLHDTIEGVGWILFILALIFALNACGVCRNCKYQTIGRDSIYVERVDSIFFRDTILEVKMKDSLVYAVADSSSHLETDVAISDAWIEDNKLHHRLENKRDLVPIRVQMPMAVSTQKTYFRQIVHQKVNYLTEWQSFWVILGKIFAIVIGASILIWLIKRKI